MAVTHPVHQAETGSLRHRLQQYNETPKMAVTHPVHQAETGRRFSPFALLKVTISDFLVREEVEQLAELFELNPREQDQINNNTAPPGLAFIRMLEKKKDFTATDVDRLLYGLHRIGHVRLFEILEKYKKDHISNTDSRMSESDHSSEPPGVKCCTSSAKYPTDGRDVYLHGQDLPAADHDDSDQIITFPVEESNSPTCVLSMDISPDATNVSPRVDCDSVSGQLRNYILATPSGYIDHLNGIFIFFRRLYGELVNITFSSVHFHVRISDLTALDRLLMDYESGYIKTGLTALLLPEEVRTQMDRLGLSLTLSLNLETVIEVFRHINSKGAAAESPDPSTSAMKIFLLQDINRKIALLQQEVLGKESVIKALRENIKALQRPVGTDGILRWSINDFAQKRKAAIIDESQGCVTSDDFFTPEGHRLFAVAYLNGHASCKGKSFSLYVAIKKGPHDVTVAWPLPYNNITFEIRSQGNIGKHWKKMFPVDGQDQRFHQPTGKQNKEVGFEDFIGLAELELPQNHFIEEDMVCVMITVNRESD